ncbi:MULTISPECIES: ATP-binding protein [unclassified Nonomuraea]|uniref:sensor histidine kinase n=1 Tax=unclassified Nonomuraea TaxID=2593643 RepID=UPI0033DB02EC
MVVPIHILMCEVEEDDALRIVSCLLEEGVEATHERVEDAESVATALRLRPPDIVFSDYRMPCLTAHDVLRLLHEAGLDVPFVLVSGPVGDERAVALMRAGARDFVCKDRLSRLAPVVRRELREAECRHRLSCLDRLAGGLAHDVSNLFGVILGHAELALDMLPADAPGRAGVERIQQAAGQGEALARRLLVPGQADRPEPVELNTVVEETAGLLRPILSAGVDLVTRLAPGLPAVGIDRAALAHALINVLVNALAAMPDGGRLTIETARAGDGGVRLTVSDTGHGMPAEVAEHAFEPFFTTREQGTGLGLPTARGTVEEAGGRTTLTSRPGSGTTIHMYLPAAR